MHEDVVLTVTVTLRSIMGGGGARRSTRRRSRGTLVPVRRNVRIANVVLVIFRVVRVRILVGIRPFRCGSCVRIVIVIVIVVIVIVIIIIVVFFVVIVGNEVTDGRVRVARVRRRGRCIIRRRVTRRWRRRRRHYRIVIRRRVFVFCLIRAACR